MKLASTYIVHVADPITDEADAYGPCDEHTATTMADRVRHDLTELNMHDVRVAVLVLRR